jgi:hypothetical protein
LGALALRVKLERFVNIAEAGASLGGGRQQQPGVFGVRGKLGGAAREPSSLAVLPSFEGLSGLLKQWF